MAARPPIVFLPGVMGSRLYFDTSQTFWDPDSTWRMLRWMPVWPLRSDDDNRRDLHARNPAGVMIDPLDSNSMSGDEVTLGWGGVVWSYYADFLEALRSLAGNGRAFAVGYDWRQDIRWLGEYAAGKLQGVLNATGAPKLNLVTHSLGGLVARSALRHDPALVPRVEKFVSICQPAVGAVILYRRLFTGLVRHLDGGGSVSDRAYRLLLGNTREAFVGNMSGLPGAMQLLPSEYFPVDAAGRPWNASIAGPITPSNLYGNALCPPGLLDAALGLTTEVLEDLTDRVFDVAGFHAWLGAPDPLPAGWPETWSVCGLGQPTEVQIAFAGSQAQPGLTPGGDGTVPILSARALPVPPGRLVEVNGLEHGGACLHPDVISLAQRVLA
jgi:pimeloyl-ACP methyl ester carboxylesterase